MAVENFIIFNYFGQEQPPEAPQYAAIASRREQDGVGIVVGAVARVRSSQRPCVHHGLSSGTLSGLNVAYSQ